MDADDNIAPLDYFALGNDGVWYLIIDHLKDDFYTGIRQNDLLPAAVMVFQRDMDEDLIFGYDNFMKHDN